MNRLLTMTAAILIVCLASTAAFAKRSAPKEIPPIRHGDLEYRVTHHVGDGYLPGFVEARDSVSKRPAWIRQIYVIRRNPNLESDVQDVFISGIKLDTDQNVLEVTNEHGGVFELNLETLAVKVVKGQAVIRQK